MHRVTVALEPCTPQAHWAATPAATAARAEAERRVEAKGNRGLAMVQQALAQPGPHVAQLKAEMVLLISRGAAPDRRGRRGG